MRNLSNFKTSIDDLVGITSSLLPPANNSNQTSFTFGIKSHGKIGFGRLQSNKAEFIRVPSNISAVNVKEFLIRQHCTRRPSLVISLIGSVEERNLRSKLFRIFQKATRNIDTWIITDGFNTNLTKLIGEIVRTNSNPTRFIRLIGIADWRSVSGVNELDIYDDEDTFDELSNNNRNDEILESNHTDFIFIDDENKQTNESILEFRAQFEKALLLSFSFIPVVLLVIEGDQDIIKQVHQAIVHNNIPVVFLENSGQCCDLFARIYHLYNESHRKKLHSEQIKRIKNSIRQKVQLNINNTSSVDYYELIYECIEKHQIFMNFVDLKVRSQIEPDIDFAILKSILIAISVNHPTKTTYELKQQQIRLALDWNRVDIVKNFIMTNEEDWKSIDLNDLFVKALVRNQVEFVELFLEHDFSLEDLCRNCNTLSILYKNENRNLKDDSLNSLRAIYTEIIRPLVGDVFDINAALSTDNLFQERFSYDRTQNKEIPIDANKELFLWSVLTGKQAFALLFWARGKNKTCAALVATLLYKTKARKDKNIRYNELADQFQSLAVEILEKFYRTNPSKCIKAIIREIPEFGNLTWLHLAVIAEAKRFIAQRAVQNVLSDIWYGYIDHTVGNRMIIFSTIMFWYSGFLPYHEELVEKTEDIPQNDDSDHYSRFIQYNASNTEYIINSFTVLHSKRSKLKSYIWNDRGCYWKKFIYRYIQNILMFVHAPYVKYLYHMYSHLIFLLLFSYVVLCDFFPLYNFKSTKCLSGSEDHLYAKLIDSDTPTNHHVHPVRNSSVRNMNNATNETFEYGLQRYERPATTEIILTIWIFTLFCEEIRQLLSSDLHSMHGKFVTYFSIIWNKLDVFGILLFFIAIILRYLPVNQCFCAARIILAVDLSLWYIRILDIFAAVKRLGPKLVMIGEMVHDMTFFMLILTVFILAFGVPTYSLLFGVQKFNWHLPRAILNLAYWQIFGELEVLDEIEKDYEISGYVMFILLVAYMTVASVLLINLLIAMFSNTFDRLHTDAGCIWKFQHYYLVCHHLTRPCLPPPLIVLSHIWRVLLYFFSRVVKIQWFMDQYIRHKNQAKFKISLDERLIRDIESIEDALGNDAFYLYSKMNRKPIDYQRDFSEDQIHSPQEMVLNKVKMLENRIRTMQTQQNNMFEYLECLMNGMKKLGGDDIEIPKQHYFDSD